MAAPNITTSVFSLNLLHPVEGPGVGRSTLLDKDVLLATLLGTADIFTNFVPGFNGRIASIDFYVTVPVSTAAKLATITTRIGGVAMTGGVLALTSANCTPAGVRVPSTPITGLNSFSSTDGITMTLSGVTAFTEGSGVIIISAWNDDTRAMLGLTLAGETAF